MIPQLLGNLNFATSPLLILLTEGLLISTVAVPGSVSAEAWPAGLYVIAVPSGMIATQLPSPVMLSITLTGVCPLNAAVANCSAVALASAVAGIGIGVPVPPMPEGRLPLAPSIEGGTVLPVFVAGGLLPFASPPVPLLSSLPLDNVAFGGVLAEPGETRGGVTTHPSPGRQVGTGGVTTAPAVPLGVLPPLFASTRGLGSDGGVCPP